MTNKQKEELRNFAREMADCADVMPTSLKKHQDRVYNACLDMIYKFDNLINEKIALLEQKEQWADETGNTQARISFEEAITILKE